MAWYIGMDVRAAICTPVIDERAAPPQRERGWDEWGEHDSEVTRRNIAQISQCPALYVPAAMD
jgi:hypothetical protein